MHTVTFVALAALVGCTLLPGGTRKVRLAENGTALADIVVAADADKAARFGAADLAWHLKEITGAEFRIITDAEPKMRFEICVGPSRRAKHTAEGLDEQECRIDIRADGIDLIGRDKPDKTSFVYTNDVNGVLGRDWPDMWDAQGSMYAVYEFLENIVGVKWLDPTDYGILLPREPSLAVPIGTRRQQPFIFARGGTWSGGSYHVIMWKGQDENAKRYHALGYGGRDARRIHNQQRLFLARHRAGGLKRSANHSFYHFYDYYWKKDSKQFREFRPDFFSVGTSDAALPAQLC